MPPGDQRRRRTKACTECRQQKLRCDAHRDYSKPCSRCQRMKLHCIISDAFKRTRKLTKVEMQREIQHLQEQLQAQEGTPRQISGDSRDWVEDTSPHWSTPSTAPPRLLMTPGQLVPDEPPCTKTRSLEDLELSSDKIKTLFSLYFGRHTSFLPILEEQPPDWFHDKSPLLFWAIAYVGSRRHDDPTLMLRLAPRVLNFAFSSLALSVSPSQTIPLIQGLLLICAWPAPVDTRCNDVSQILACATMQLAIRAGLHIFGNGQEFSRTVFQHMRDDSSSRAQLWAHCLIVCQSLSMGDGLPPLTALDSFDFGIKHPDLWAALTPDLQLRLKLHRLQIDALSTFTRGGFITECTAENSQMLNSLIKLYDKRLLDLVDGSLTEHDQFFFDSARLHIHVFRLFSDVQLVDKVGFLQLFSFACTVIEGLNRLETMFDLATSGPIFDMWMIMLAAFTILRLLRSGLKQYLDFKRGEHAYFTAIHLHRKRSVQNNDLQARGAVIMAQLWSSDSIFKRADGSSDSLKLRTRSRLSLGVVFDCFWWWRAEFGGQANLFTDAPKPGHNATGLIFPPTSEPLPLNPNPSMIPQNGDGFPEDPAFFHGVVPDWDWAASFEMPWEDYM